MSKLINSIIITETIIKEVSDTFIKNILEYQNHFIEIIASNKKYKEFESFESILIDYFNNDKKDCAEWYFWFLGLSFDQCEIKQKGENFNFYSV